MCVSLVCSHTNHTQAIITKIVDGVRDLDRYPYEENVENVVGFAQIELNCNLAFDCTYLRCRPRSTL